MSSKTYFDKVWDAHVIEQRDDGWCLIHVDRILLHDLSGSAALAELERRDLSVANPTLVRAIPDHAVSSAPGRSPDTFEKGGRLYANLERLAGKYGIPFHRIGEVGQGIVHVVAPEQGLTLPGLTIVCGDSHTCTHGGLGAIGFGIGTLDTVHALATQTMWQKKPRQMRIVLDGTLREHTSAKDVILYVISKLGTGAGAGFSIEFAGEAVRSFSVEERLTICNLSVELGARFGFIQPDDTTFDYLRGRPFAPACDAFEGAVADWKALSADGDGSFDAEHHFDVSEIGPMVSWGTSPEETLSLGEALPFPHDILDPVKRQSASASMEYMGLEPGGPLARTRIDWVFIGSCTNSRMSDLRAAAALIDGKHVAEHVTAWVVPGSQQVKLDAEREGIDQVFRAAGFEWREPSCSLCVAANGEAVPPGARVVSTSNRNFKGRQGPASRTHLASPQTAAVSAIAGYLVDPGAIP